MNLYQQFKEVWRFIKSDGPISQTAFNKKFSKLFSNVWESIVNNAALLIFLLTCLGSTLSFFFRAFMIVVFDNNQEVQDKVNLLVSDKIQYDIVLIGFCVILILVAYSIFRIRSAIFWERNLLGYKEIQPLSIGQRLWRHIKNLIFYLVYILNFTIILIAIRQTRVDIFFFAMLSLVVSTLFFVSGFNATKRRKYSKKRNLSPLFSILMHKRDEYAQLPFSNCLLITAIMLLLFFIPEENVYSRFVSDFNTENSLFDQLFFLTWTFIFILCVFWIEVLLFYQGAYPSDLFSRETSNPINEDQKSKTPKMWLIQDFLIISMCTLFVILVIFVSAYSRTH